MGFLVLEDPLKPDILPTLAQFHNLGITLKIITGDNALVAASVCRELQIPDPQILTGKELNQLDDQQLGIRATEVDIFAELEPNQKQRIILALKKNKK